MLLLLDPSELNFCYRRADTELGEATLTPDSKRDGKLPCQAATKNEVPPKNPQNPLGNFESQVMSRSSEKIHSYII